MTCQVFLPMSTVDITLFELPGLKSDKKSKIPQKEIDHLKEIVIYNTKSNKYNVLHSEDISKKIESTKTSFKFTITDRPTNMKKPWFVIPEIKKCIEKIKKTGEYTHLILVIRVSIFGNKNDKKNMIVSVFPKYIILQHVYPADKIKDEKDKQDKLRRKKAWGVH